MTFQDAEDACADEGGQLVSIHDVFTQDTVALVCRGGGASRCWIGLKRALYDEWTDGSIVNYTNYEKGK
nr:hypothetical protein BaRGS_032152 [Batillaria attramentaria]